MPIVRKLNADLRAAVLDPATKEKLETTGNFPNPMTPLELLTFIQGEQKMWKPVVEAIARSPLTLSAVITHRRLTGT